MIVKQKGLGTYLNKVYATYKEYGYIVEAEGIGWKAKRIR